MDGVSGDQHADQSNTIVESVDFSIKTLQPLLVSSYIYGLCITFVFLVCVIIVKLYMQQKLKNMTTRSEQTIEMIAPV